MLRGIDSTCSYIKSTKTFNISENICVRITGTIRAAAARRIMDIVFTL